MGENRSQDKYTIQAVDECFDVIFLLSVPEFQQLTEQDIAVILEMKRNKIFRLLKTLENRGIVRKKDGRWAIAPEIVKISDGFRRYIARKRAELEKMESEYLAA